jgi:autotransporter-associated beta strand protein
MTNTKPTKNRLRLYALFASLGLSASAQAADGTWISTGGAANWSLGTNWQSGTVADGIGATANFNNNITTNSTITIDAAQTTRTVGILNIGDLTLADKAFTIQSGTLVFDNTSASASAQLNVLSGAGAQTTTISSAVTLTSSLSVANNSTGNLALSGVIGGSGGLTLAGGTGSISLLGATNSYGSTTLNSGTLLVAVGSLGSSGTITFNGGTIASNSTGGQARTFTNAVVFGGDLTTGTSTYTGAITLSGGTTLNTGNHTINTANADATLSGVISGGGSLTKDGSKSLTLSNATNSYGGGTTLNAGTLLVNTGALGGGTLTINAGTIASNSTTLGRTITNAVQFNGDLTTGISTNTGLITLSGTTTLSTGNHTITASFANATLSGQVTGVGGLTKDGAGTLTLSNAANDYTGATAVTGGTLFLSGSLASTAIAVGNGATFNFNKSGTNGLTKNFTLTEGASLIGSGTNSFASSGTTTVAADLSDGFTAITLGTFAKSGILSFDLTNIQAGTYSLFTGTTPTGSFTSVVGTGFNVVSNFAGTVGAFDYSFANSGNILTITASAVPEPATYAALVGLGILGFAVYRRRPSA